MTFTTHRLQTSRGVLPGLTLVSLILMSGCQGNPSPQPGSPTASTGSGRPAREAEPGLAVGTRAPAFALADQTGAEQTLDKLRKEGPVAIVFFRSARW
jgi:hypothetical protein